MSKRFLPYNKQSINEKDIESVANVLRGPFLTTGPQSDLFESEIAAYVGSRYAVVCNSGTAALQLAMAALEVGKNDRVLTSPISFIADANVVRHMGGDVLFADISDETANMSAKSAGEVLATHEGVKAIMPVHFGGQPFDLEKFSALADSFGVSLIEDACHALGAEYRDRKGIWHKVGDCAFSKLTAFSFHPIKSITTGEGGCVTTNDPELYRRLKQLRSHGTTRDPALVINEDQAYTHMDGIRIRNPWYYEMQMLGYNYRITDFQCALGRSQLNRLDVFLDTRLKLMAVYRELLSDAGLLEVIKPLDETSSTRHSGHLFVVRSPFRQYRGGRANFMNFLKDRGVSSQVHYMPLYRHPYYKEFENLQNKLLGAERYYGECLSLPLYPDMDLKDVQRVISALREGVDLFFEA
jgi:UDP-4-amino-4,6-dideoxy-N-acetyl-beta-L-altrosamine transaminase